jgi:hypothetical protein
MSEFAAYLQLGFEHISDVNGYDHIIFLMALCSVYAPSSWKKVLLLSTAFTLGHSITLALSVMNIVSIEGKVIELLIPVTILLTAMAHAYRPQEPSHAWRSYSMATAFGLIHGMGFSNYLKALLGEEESILQPLLAFNIGLEIGQLLIVGILMLGASIFMGILKVKLRDWAMFFAGASASIALLLIKERWLF